MVIKKRKKKASKKILTRRARHSKAKGAGFDIKICRALSKWINGIEQPEIFWRTATSGGRASRAAKLGMNVGMHGDIMSLDEKGKWLTNVFFFECKSYSKIDFSLFLEGKGNVVAWWKKCTQQAKDANKWPVLIMKQNGSDTYVMFFTDMSMFSEFTLQDVSRIEIKNEERVTIVPFSKFLSVVAPKALKTFFSRGKRKGC
jgi:hypothetical protein